MSSHRNFLQIKLIAFIFLLITNSWSQARVFPADTWQKSSPEGQDVDSKKLDDAFTYLGTKMDASETVAIRHGYMIYKGKNSTKSHGIWSCSKSFTSSVLGLLLDSGKVNLTDPAYKYASTLKASYPAVTLRHFATMTSGYDANGGSYGPKNEDGSRSPFAASKPSFAPGTYYAYWDDAQRMFGAVLSKAVGKDFSSLFMDNVAKKIGMKNTSWSNRDGNYQGLTVGDSAGGVNTSAESLARYLYLFLNKGNWNGTQILSEGWVREATKAQVPTGTKIHVKSQGDDGGGVYGYNWWLNGVNGSGRFWPDAPVGTYACLGAKANMGYVIPELDMVVVRIGTSGSMSNSVRNEFLKRITASAKK